jgi:hypothetical protein
MRYVVLALFVAACANDFDPPSIVLGPRLLAIAAEPPETAPGGDIVLTPITANADGLTFEWTADLSTRALASSAGQYTVGEAATPITLVWDGENATLSGETTRAAIDALFAILGDAELGTPEGVVRYVYETVGLTFVVDVRAYDQDGALVLDGFKRVVLTPRDGVTTNPPPPRFAIDGQWVSAREGDPHLCTPAITIEAGTVMLEPDPEEPWLETFPSLDLEGRVVEGEEAAYYSWFSTGGEFTFGVTRVPERAAEWETPEEPGEYPLWLVVRDGHLGISACRATVIVEP